MADQAQLIPLAVNAPGDNPEYFRYFAPKGEDVVAMSQRLVDSYNSNRLLDVPRTIYGAWALDRTVVKVTGPDFADDDHMYGMPLSGIGLADAIIKTHSQITEGQE